MFLLDTNIVSEMRKGSRADASVLAWSRSVPAGALYLSVITLLELKKGVLLVERRDPRQGAALRQWLDNQVLAAFDGRILALDAKIALRCAALHVPDPRPDRDAMIAATAAVHGFTLATRNARDFDQCGAAVVNPFDFEVKR